MVEKLQLEGNKDFLIPISPAFYTRLFDGRV